METAPRAGGVAGGTDPELWGGFAAPWDPDGDTLETPAPASVSESVVMVTEGCFLSLFFFFSPSFKKNSYQFNIILVLSNNSYLKRSLRWL